MNILITGATGLIGSALVGVLLALPRVTLRAAIRQDKHHLPEMVEVLRVGSLAAETDWGTALQGVDVVIHAAARTHVMNEDAAFPLAEFRKTNVSGTLSLARQAVAAGVTRFVFISSVGVNGNRNNCPFTEADIETPVEPYAVSKKEAEEGLRRLADESGLEVVIIRPPLVYGPNAPGNFGRLIRIVDKGIPLPLGSVHNKRSFVALDNLVDLIVTCIDHPAAANQIFLAGDGEDLSTTELLQRMAKAMGKPARLIPVPTKALEFGAMLLGKRDITQRLCSSLQVDISKARDLLGWVPPISVDEGLRRAAKKT